MTFLYLTIITIALITVKPVVTCVKRKVFWSLHCFILCMPFSMLHVTTFV